MKILILAGTNEARDLARKLLARGHEVTSSLAGRTGEPVLPEGRVRMGDFGNAGILSDYLTAEGFDLLIDATHPYAGTISTDAVTAAAASKVRLLRIERPAWTKPPEARWKLFPDIASAFRAVPARKFALVTTGQKELEVLGECPKSDFLVRLIDPPKLPLPANAQLLLGRPPYTVKSETTLMRDRGITHVVTKNSGGDQTRAKLDAAAAMGIVTFVVERPKLPEAPSVASVEEAVDRVHDLASGSA